MNLNIKGRIQEAQKVAQKALESVEGVKQFIIEAGSDNVSVFSGKFEGGVHCQQVPDEFAEFISAILSSGKEIKTYLEIGVASGGTTYHIDHFIKPETIVLVDNNSHWKSPLRIEILKDVRRKEVIGDSKSETVIQQVHAISQDYDLIIIDGDHTYPGVRADADNYIPMLAEGGFVMLHDSALPEWGILKTVQELMDDDRLEFVAEYKSKMRAPLGIALFRKAAKA